MAERRDTGWDDGLRAAFAERRRRREARDTSSRPAPRPGRFEHLGEIARDETSILLRARDREVDRDVALRVSTGDTVREDALRALLEETQVAGQLQHPGILPVYAAGLLVDGRPFVAQKLVEGETLAELLARREDPRLLLGILEQAAHAVAYAHARGAAHGHLDPTRIHVGPHGDVVVSGWDRAIRANGDPRPVREDVRALGMTLGAVLAESVDDDLTLLVHACLAADAHARPRNAGIVARGIGARLARIETTVRQAEIEAAQRAAEAEEERSRDAHEHARSRLARRARRRVAGLAVLCLLAVSVTAVSVIWRAREDRASVARVRTRVASALREAARHEAAREWATARAWAVNAVALAGDDAALAAQGVVMRDRIAVAEANGRAWKRLSEEDAALLDRLDLVRRQHEQNAYLVLRAGKLPGLTFCVVRRSTVHAGYAAAFRSAGYDVFARATTVVADEIRGRPRAAELAAALDAWSGVASGEASRLRLRALAAAIDPDESRREIREAWIRGETGGLARRTLLTDASTAPAAWLGNLGWALRRAGDTPAAAAILREAAARCPGDRYLRKKLGHVLFEMGRTSAAVSHFEAERALAPDAATPLTDLANALWNQGYRARAIELQQRAPALEPDCATSWSTLAGFLVDAKRFDEAVDAARRALSILPDFPPAHHNLGVALLGQGDHHAATGPLRRAAESGCDDSLTLSLLGWALYGAGQAEEAIAPLRRAAALDDGDPVSLTMLGIVLLDRGRLEEACESLHQAIALAPEDPTPHNNLGLALRGLGRLPEAIVELRQAVELDASNAVVLANLGATLGEAGELRAAEDTCRRAILLDPKLADAMSSLGVTLARQNRVDEAEAALRRAIELDPVAPRHHLNLGALRCDVRRDHVGAEGEFRTAIALDPDLAVAHHFLGNALHAQGRYIEAIEAQEIAVRLEPANDAYRAGLGVALASRGASLGQEGRHREAVEALRRAARHCPRSAEIHRIHHNLAAALSGLGRHEEAITVLRETLALSPATDAEAPNGLAWLLANAPDPELRRPPEAIRFARLALERAPGWRPALNTLGAALHRAGRHQDSIRVLGESIRHADGDEPEARWTRVVDGLFLSMAHARLGNAEDARTWYARSVQRLAKDAPPEKHRAEELERFRAEAEALLADIGNAKEGNERKTKEGR